jgi:hypothetical protein
VGPRPSDRDPDPDPAPTPTPPSKAVSRGEVTAGQLLSLTILWSRVFQREFRGRPTLASPAFPAQTFFARPLHCR